MKKQFNMLKELFTIKRFSFIVLLFVLFFLFQDSINTFIKNNLVVKNDFPYLFVDLFLVSSIIIFFIHLIVKLLKDNYIFAYNQNFLLVFGFIILAYYNFSNNLQWDFIEFHLLNTNITYISFLLFLWFVFIIIYTTRGIVNSKKKVKENNNVFYGDIPLGIIADDELNYKEVTRKLIDIIRTEDHKKSFTVGLIGPWGNGKSTVFGFVKEKIKDDDIILIDFLPFLNHNEKDIINEFFTSLGNKLSKYSGVLKNDVIEYSNKVSSLIKDKSIKSFFEKNTLFENNQTANDLYNSINKNLIKIDKKVVVFIDDLDRLNEKEILQVLKLIRNTANFKSTIFIVAMDKDYVIERLKKNDEILNSRFIDKFFQLEIYLPKIDKSNLMKVFRDLLVDSNVIPNKDELMNAINHKDNLFTDYIKNIRDVKRVVNQIIFEYPFIKDEIDLKDFINFIYFKLTFPKIIYILNENRNKFLEVISDNIYSLKEVKNNQVGNEINLFRPELLEVLKKYEVFKIYKNTFDYLNIEDNKKLLFIKSLAYLFGSQNQTETYKSIRFENNFRKLMQQRLLESDIKESEFKELLKETNDNLNKKVKDFNNKIPQLFNRFNYFNTKKESEIKKVIKIICIIYNEYEEEYEIDSLKLLGVFTNRIFNNKKNSDFTKWLKENIFDNSKLLPKRRLLLLGFLNAESHSTRFWYLNENYIENKVVELFREYLYQFDNNLWDFDDFSFYGVYHSIKKIRNLQDNINSILLEFWNKNDIECLCVQATNIDFDIIGQYKISDTEIEIFGSKSNYYKFIKNHRDSNKETIKEYLEFLFLFEITNYNLSINFDFIKFNLMRDKIILLSKNSFYSLDKNIVNQVFFVSESNQLLNKVKIRGDKFRIYQYGNLFYYLAHIPPNKNTIKAVEEYAYYLIESLQNDNFVLHKNKLWSKENFYEHRFIDIKLFSLQFDKDNYLSS